MCGPEVQESLRDFHVPDWVHYELIEKVALDIEEFHPEEASDQVQKILICQVLLEAVMEVGIYVVDPQALALEVPVVAPVVVVQKVVQVPLIDWVCALCCLVAVLKHPQPEVVEAVEGERNDHHELCLDQGQTWFPLAHRPHPCENEVVAEEALEVVLVVLGHQCDLNQAWICHHQMGLVVA